MSTVSPRPAMPAFDLGAVFDEHFDYVWGTLRRLGVRDADLEDLVHEVFLKIHARSADYDPTRPIRPWLFGFAYRVAADYRRLARHRLEVLHVPIEIADPQTRADERLAEGEDRALLMAALDTVDIDRRAVLVLHDIDGVPIPEVAAALGVPLNTAYSRLRIARGEFTAAAKRLRRARGER